MANLRKDSVSVLIHILFQILEWLNWTISVRKDDELIECLAVRVSTIRDEFINLTSKVHFSVVLHVRILLAIKSSRISKLNVNLRIKAKFAVNA